MDVQGAVHTWHHPLPDEAQYWGYSCPQFSPEVELGRASTVSCPGSSVEIVLAEEIVLSVQVWEN